MRYAVGGSPALNELGGELLVCDAAGQTVHRLTGEARCRFELVVEGDLVELADDDVTAALEAAGLIVAVGNPVENVVGMSRRKIMAIGAAAAAAGVVTVALPGAVAAQSGGPPPSSSTTSSSTTTTAPPLEPTGTVSIVASTNAGSNVRVFWYLEEPVDSENFIDFTYTVIGSSNVSITNAGPFNSGSTLRTVGTRIAAGVEVSVTLQRNLDGRQVTLTANP